MRLTILLISSLFFLQSCSYLKISKYDPVEYYQSAMVKSFAETVYESCDYAHPGLVDMLELNTRVLTNVTMHLPNNEEYHELAKKLNLLVDQFVERYYSNEDMSIAYCEMKLESIIETSDQIQILLGGKFR